MKKKFNYSWSYGLTFFCLWHGVHWSEYIDFSVNCHIWKGFHINLKINLKMLNTTRRIFLIYILGLFRPGLAGPVLPTASGFIHWLTKSPFSSKPSKHHYTQTVRARKLKFLNNIHPRTMSQVSGVTCHMWGVVCHVSGIRCHLSPVMCEVSCVMCQASSVCVMFFFFFLFFGKVVELVGGRSVISRAYPV